MHEHALRRSLPRVTASAVGVLAIVGILGLLVSRGAGLEELWMVGIFGLIGFGVAGFSLWNGWHGFCPDCGYKNDWLTSSPGAFECKGCGAYLEGPEGSLVVQGQDALSERPVYEADLPDHPRWPEGCCVCGAAPTRSLSVELEERRDGGAEDVAARIETLGTVGIDRVTTFSVEVPHCDEHEDGAALLRGRDEQGAGPRIAFRSRRFQRAFEEINPV